MNCIKWWSATWWISGGSGVATLPSVWGSSSSSLSLQWICLPCSNGKLTQIEWWIFWEDWDMSVARRLLRYYMNLQPLDVSVVSSEFKPAGTSEGPLLLCFLIHTVNFRPVGTGILLWSETGRYIWDISAQSVCGIKPELILSQMFSATCAGPSAPVVPVCSPTQQLVQA